MPQNLGFHASHALVSEVVVDLSIKSEMLLVPGFK
jgi:hypothetical protein